MITAQVSLYPLRQVSIEPAIREAVRVFRQHGVETRIGEMSTLVWREEEEVFAALQEAFHRAACWKSDEVRVTSRWLGAPLCSLAAGRGRRLDCPGGASSGWHWS